MKSAFEEFTRREWLTGASGLAGALASASCGTLVRTSEFLNVLVHGSFTLDLGKTQLALRAPALVGHVYGARSGANWHSPRKNATFSLNGIQLGDRDKFSTRAQKTYPQIKHADIKKGLEYWTVRLPIPLDAVGFRYVEGNKQRPVLQGKSLLAESEPGGTPMMEKAPSVVLLTFRVEDWKSVELRDVTEGAAEEKISFDILANRSLSFYAEPAFPPAGDEVERAAACYEVADSSDPRLEICSEGRGYDLSGPFHDVHLGVSATDTRHLYEILMENNAAGSAHEDAGFAGCLPLGM